MKDQKKQSGNASSEIRKQHNLDLMRRMRGGESLNAYDSKASWYPPRPVIKKDDKEISRVYDSKAVVTKSWEPEVAKPAADELGNVVKFVPVGKGKNHFDEAG